MTIYRICLNPEQFNHFLRAGSLEIRSCKNNILLESNDHIFVSEVNENVMYGPFNIINGILGIYVFVDPAILCETFGSVYKYNIDPIRETTIVKINNPNKIDNGADFLSITGDLELDGLLAASVFDNHLDTDCIIFLNSNKELITYYLSKLDKFNIEHYVDRFNKILIRSHEVCERCKVVDSRYYNCKEFVQGYLASQIMVRRTLERVMRDAPPELQKTVIVSEICNPMIINKIEGSGIILLDNVHGFIRVSGLSVRSHPFIELLPDSLDDEEMDDNEHAESDFDHYRLGAAIIVIKNIFRLSGYIVEPNDRVYFNITKYNVKSFMLVLNNYNELNNDSTKEYIKSHLDNGYIIILNNDFDPYLKIQNCMAIKIFLEKNIFDGNNITDSFQNVEGNTLLPVHKKSTSELRYKIELIWRV